MRANNRHNAPFLPLLDVASHDQHLFNLAQYPLINIQSCLKNMSADQASLFNILHTLITEELPQEMLAYKEAHQQQDWEKIDKLAHKMKGGAIYTGLVKLQYACQHFEDYFQSKRTALLEDLYQQILSVIEQTRQSLEILVTDRPFPPET